MLLEAVDVLRSMIKALSEGGSVALEVVNAVQRRLEDALGSGSAKTTTIAWHDGQDTSRDHANCGFLIRFRPHADMLLTGNEPMRLIRELAGMGELETRLDADQVPPFGEMDPEHCYLGWEFKLRGNIDEAAIREVFEWVEDDCDLDITRQDAEVESNDEPVATVSRPEKEKQAAVQPEQGMQGARGGSIRVDTDKIDSIINMVGELVITQSMLGQIGSCLEDNEECADIYLEKLQKGLSQLEQTTRELQDGIMNMRMLPISFIFNRFPRLVHDLSKKLDKEVDLVITGEHTEVDKTVLEKLGDPLVHLVRNALDHGLEGIDERRTGGKADRGTIRLDACHKGGSIVITITDDGRGLDREKILAKAYSQGLLKPSDNSTDDEVWKLIFSPGFSTAEEVSDVSGRGVGMDVVMKNINILGGSIDIDTKPGRGTVITVRLPLTLSILDGQLIKVSDQVYVIPLTGIVESLLVDSACQRSVAGKPVLYSLRDEYIPTVGLQKLFSLPETSESSQKLMVVVESDGEKTGLIVDDLLAQQQVVIKSLDTNYRKVEWISGATILGDGTVALILDIPSLVRAMKRDGMSTAQNAA